METVERSEARDKSRSDRATGCRPHSREEDEAFRRKYERLAAKARELMKKGARDTDSPEP